MTSKVYDNGSGATLLQSDNQTVVGAALSTITPVSAGTPFGFSTSAKMNALVDMVVALRAACIAAGIAKAS